MVGSLQHQQVAKPSPVNHGGGPPINGWHYPCFHPLAWSAAKKQLASYASVFNAAAPSFGFSTSQVPSASDRRLSRTHPSLLQAHITTSTSYVQPNLEPTPRTPPHTPQSMILRLMLGFILCRRYHTVDG